MKKFYHMAPFSSLRSMSVIGLKPNKNPGILIKNNEDDTEYGKVYFAEGLAGTVAQQAYVNKGYQDIKSGNTEGFAERDVNMVNGTGSLEEYLDEPVYVGFDESLVENEGNFMYGETEESVEPKDLNICVVKNKVTDEVKYDGKTVLDFMMSMVPVDSIHFSGNAGANRDELNDDAIQSTVAEYYKAHEADIEKYKSGEYTLEEIPLVEFLKTFGAKNGLVIYRTVKEKFGNETKKR